MLNTKFKEIFDSGILIKAVFSNKRKKSLEYSRVTMKQALVKGNPVVQAEYTYEKKVTHRNLSADEACELAVQLVNDDFKQVNISTLEEEIQILAAKPEKPRITSKKAAMETGNGAGNTAGNAGNQKSVSPSQRLKGDMNMLLPEHRNLIMDHNRKKNYVIPDGVPCDFLIKLGVMGEDGKVFQRAYSKFRQINRYLEIVEDCYDYLDRERTLRIIDFGCGKAYLTFALYHYLKVLKGRNVEIIGLDLKEDVIDFCNGVAQELGYDELKFLKGDIADYTSDHADMVMTLHACDTATDYAFINAVQWNTKVILSVPCCQHELFKQIKNDIHNPMLKYGILKDRLTEYLTDGLRGLKLEAKGYDVNMIEFTGLEHTARNIMIKAVKTRPNKAKMEKAQKEYEALRDFYSVHPTIDQL